MRRILFTFILSYSFSLLGLDQPSSKKISHAQILFDDGLYSEASVLYQEILDDDHLDKEILDKISYQLAFTSFLNRDYQKVIDLLQDKTTSPEEIYIKALSLSRLNKNEEAISVFNNYLADGNKDRLAHYNDAIFELGLAHFQLGQFYQAKQNFALAAIQKEKRNLAYSANLYLARIDILEEKYRNAEKILTSLDLQLEADNPFHYEISYLQGQLYLHQKNYLKAAAFFEQALPIKNPEHCSWFLDTLYQLGWTYLKLAENTSDRAHFDQAESSFKKLLTVSATETNQLALGQAYIARGHRLKEEKPLQQAKDLLSNKELFTTKEGQTQALLLLTEAAASYYERDKLYRQLTTETKSDQPLYALGWYLKGLNDFEEGKTLIESNRPTEAIKILDRSIASLKKAFELLKDQDRMRAGLALKYQGQAYLLQKNKDSYLNAFNLLDTFIQQQENILVSVNDLDEIYYLRGLAASKISENEENSYVAIARDSLEKQLFLFPEGDYADQALYLLGTLSFQHGNYLQAKAEFQQLINEHPESSLAANSCYWIAKSAEELVENKEEIRIIKRQVFEKYPQSTYAAEAFFFLYNYEDYIVGDADAIEHLQMMKDRYPDSPFLMNAQYILGSDHKRNRKNKEGKQIHKRNLLAAIDQFHEMEITFDSLNSRNMIPTSELEYYITLRYRATLERALANIAVAEESKGAKKQIYLEYAADVFQQIREEFENSQHPLTQQLNHGEPYSPIQEEADYGLAQSYIKGSEDLKADQILKAMVEKYQEAKITRGYYLSKALYERAMIAGRKNQYEAALAYLSQSDDASKGKILSTDEKLDLWIQQSLFLKALNQMDKAMLVLSKVINEDAASSLRLKAMFLRAEIYQQQGRHELAKKQLDATAKKGGEWAQKAKEKMDKDYGYQ